MASSSSTTPTQPTAATVGLYTGRSLRDSLAVFESCTPTKRRCIGGKVVTGDDGGIDDVQRDASNSDDEIKTKKEPLQSKLERRSEDERNSVKRCLNEMIPFIYSKKRRVQVSTTDNDLESEKGKGAQGDNKETVQVEKDKEEQLQKREAREYDIYAEKLRKLKKENNDIQKRKQRIIHNYANLVYSYEYGLRAVSKLNDLTSAPDNVMKGNDRIVNIFE